MPFVSPLNGCWKGMPKRGRSRKAVPNRATLERRLLAARAGEYQMVFAIPPCELIIFPAVEFIALAEPDGVNQSQTLSEFPPSTKL